VRLTGGLALLLALASCGPPDAVPVEQVLAHFDQFARKRVALKTKLRSGARCRQGEEGEWRTYCKDCVYCRGPLVIDAGTVTSTDTLDWPMILGGTWEYEDIRCKGPLNNVTCYPFELGKSYVIQGVLEDQRPPKLLVEKFWAVAE
jgi:hypothetical protein